MELKRFTLIFSLMVLMNTSIYINGKPLFKFMKKKKYDGRKEDIYKRGCKI